MTLGYILPITNRLLNDVQQGYPKGKFGVSDWQRIDNNTQYARDLVESTHSVLIPWIELATPTREVYPPAADINALVRNIISVQNAAVLAQNAQLYTLKANYEDGSDKQSPDYLIVNAWEKVIDLIVQRYLTFIRGRVPVIGIAVVGGDLNRQNQWR